MRQTPWRPDNEISQTFNSGVCTVYTQRDGARPGFKPDPILGRKAFLRYDEQRLGLNRYYAGRQVNVDAERVIRVPRGPDGQVPTPQDVVRTENGRLYRVDFVQTVPGVWPASLDLTLSRFVQKAGAPLPPPEDQPEDKPEEDTDDALV